ncbi:MAG: sulfite exporter TauE/SafE family protein [Deltaproteobacteria bacterium]|nr:MAG: sulfite exporter TauE/SafE family protein [Deltaproteobacteria bacterium]
MEKQLLLAGVFLFISMLFSMIGMGGGILYVPILLFAGYSMKIAPGISLILIMSTSLAALFHFYKNKKVDWKLALVIDPPTDIMAFVGGYFSALVPENILQGLLAAILLLAGVLMIKKKSESGVYRQPTKPWYWHRHFDEVDYSVNLPLVLTATAAIGILAGMLGITGGIIKLPIMVLLCGVPMDIAVATSTVMVALTAGSGVIGHALHGNVDWHTGLTLALAAIIGGLIGSRISLNTDKSKLKRIFGFIILLIALQIIYKLTTQ